MVLLLVWSELIIIQKQMHIYWSTFVVYVYVLFFEKITMVTRSAKITKKSNKIRTDLFANYALFVTT